MAVRNLYRGGSALGKTGTPTAAPIRVDSSTNTIKAIVGGSGTTEVEQCDVSTAQTLTTKTLTSPTVNGGTISTATLSGNIESDTKVLAAAVTYTTNTVLADITGLTWALIAGKTYQFEVDLYTTQTTNAGLQVAFHYTNSLTLTSLQASPTQAVTGTASQLANVTTTTDQTALVNNKTAAYTRTNVQGTFVVNAAGTFSIQACQNTSNSDTTTIALGSYGRVTRVN